MARILLIDDDEVALAAMEAILAGSEHEVATAGEGGAGLRLFKEAPADLVVTDILMPGMEGLSLIRNLRADYPDLPIVAVTSGDETFDSELLLEVAEITGADGLMKKPVHAHAFLTSIDRALALA